MVDSTERGIGLEIIQYNIAKILIEQINDEIDTQETLWENRDTEWNQISGQDLGGISLEHVDSSNITKGHRPSLIKNPEPNNFPNISIMAYQARPKEGELVDQASNFNTIVDIEAFVKGETEGQTDARCHRIMEAIHQVLVRNEKLDGASLGWENDPLVTQTDIFIGTSESSQENIWFWHGVRIRYNCLRHNKLPSV